VFVGGHASNFCSFSNLTAVPFVCLLIAIQQQKKMQSNEAVMQAMRVTSMNTVVTMAGNVSGMRHAIIALYADKSLATQSQALDTLYVIDESLSQIQANLLKLQNVLYEQMQTYLCEQAEEC
jgi:hypothetical protein